MALSFGKSLRLASDHTEMKTEIAPSASEFDVRWFVGALARRRLMILGTLMLVMAAAILYVLQATPLFTGRSYVMIDTRKTKVTSVEAVLSGMTADLSSLQSEIEILRSRALIGRVVAKLNLTADSEFNVELTKSKDSSTLGGWWGEIVGADWRRVLGLEEEEVLSAADEKDRATIRVVDAFLRHMTVSPVGRSYVINISFISRDANKAANIANTIADLYIVEQLEAKFEATRRANEWLNQRLTDMRQQVETAERAVAAYRDQNGLIETKEATIASQQLNELNTQLTLARATRAEKEANLRQVQELLKSSNNIDTAAQVLTSPLIARLREQETEVLRKEAELSSRYGDRHPRIIDVRAEVRDLRRKIGDEVQKIAKSQENEVAAARAREQSLQSSLAGLERQAGTQTRAQVQLRQLQREADATRALYENFLTRFKETSEQEDFQQADARIISRAEVPQAPSSPRTFLILGVAFVGAIGLGIFLVILVERLDNGFRSPDQIESLTGAPTLAMVPSLRRKGVRTQTPEDYILEKPQSAYGEAVRSMRTALMLANVDRPPKLVLLTSALPGEGKSTLALSLGRLAAQSGQKSKVILIDCDLRRPRVGKALGLDSAYGLVDVLVGRKSLEEVVQIDQKSGLHVIPTRAGTPNPTDVLGSEQMNNLLLGLSKHYDLVVIDSPPVLAVSDARVLARMADAVIFIVRYERTPRDVVMAGLKHLMEIGAKVGVAISQVNTRKQSRYGYNYGGYGGYYGKYRDYYVE